MSEAGASRAERAVPVEIHADAVCKAFGDHRVLEEVGLEIRRGETVAIVGASGSGKTVLLHILMGLLSQDTGRVLVAHHRLPGSPLVDLGDLDDEALEEVRLSWAVVFQHNALYSGTVYENCAVWLQEHTDLKEREIRERVRRSLEAVALDVADVMEKDRDDLSGGMAKRVAVARAVAQDPILLFYDEPTTGLDPVSSALLHELIWKTHYRPREDGIRRTTVIVTHDRDLLRRVHPRVIMLHDAQVCFDGPYEEFTRSTHAATREYLQAMPVLQNRPPRERPVVPPSA
ncbi:MAG: ABC transporter ATP-binding protein [Planctomycetota bacterium]